MDVTVVLPFFNEEALLPDLPATLDRVRDALDGHGVRILAVDDGSTDRTRAGLDALDGVEVAGHAHNRGVGAAIATGIERASGDAVLVYDPDEPYAAACLAEVLASVEQGADMATLSPYHPDGSVVGVSSFRLLLSRGASRLYRRRLGSDLHTFTCAVRAYRLPRARELLPCPDDFTASAYLMAAALRAGWRVVEVPAVLSVRTRGASKMRIARTIRAHLRLLRDLAVTARGSKPGS